MPWVRFDDDYPSHRKVKRLSDAAFRLHTECIIWSAKHLTDGWIPADELADACPQVIGAKLKRALAEVAGRVWHRLGAGERCLSEQCPPGPAEAADGWVIHDYWDYQPSKEAVLKERAAAAERQRRRRAKDGTFVESESGHAVTHALVTAPVTRESRPPRPVPVPKGREGPTTNSQGDVRNGRAQEPPSKCPKHLEDPDPPPCGHCADARKVRERWEAARNARLAAAPKCRNHRGQPAHNCALCRAEALEGATA